MTQRSTNSKLDRLEQRLESIEGKLDRRLDALEAKSVCNVGLLEFWLVDKIEELERGGHQRADALERTLIEHIGKVRAGVAEHHEQMVDAVRRLSRRAVNSPAD